MRHDGDLFLAVGDALVRQLGRVVFLRGTGLHADRLATGVGRIKVLRVARSDAVRGAHLDVGNQVCLLLALGGNREGRDADVELGAQCRDDRRELRVAGRSLTEAHDLGQRLVDVDVVSLRSL